MNTSKAPYKNIICVLFILTPTLLHPQGTLTDYQRADSLRSRVSKLVYDTILDLEWVEKSNRFWYRKNSRDGKEFILVDAERLERKPAFDHTRLADSLSLQTGKEFKANDLPFNRITFIDEGQVIEFVVDSIKWTCNLTTYECKEGEKIEPRRRRRWFSGWREEQSQKPVVSPDSTWEAHIKNYNLYIRPRENKEEEYPLSFDGSEGGFYSSSIAWSPDSKKLVTNRLRPGHERLVHYIESSPDDQLQPKHTTRVYTKPGDILTIAKPKLFHVDTKKQIEVKDDLFSNPFIAYTNHTPKMEWREDSRAFTFEYNERGHQVYRIIEVNADNGNVRALIEEQSKTFIDYSGKHYRYDIHDGKEIIWASERDGWNHLYLYDGVTGNVKNQITRGKWVVRRVDHIDEEKRQMTFRASGRERGQDPYLIHYYRINFNGSGLKKLTEGHGNHSAAFSSDKGYFVDTYSGVNSPPVSVLRCSSDGQVIMELEKTDIKDLLNSEWKIPEVFKARGRDGKTDIWGVIYRPTNFDKSKKYRVIEYIYAGPHSSHVPKTFRSYRSQQALAELGFIVVQIDGMGTSNRSKAFHDVCWKNLKDAGFPDRILWHRAVAKKYAYYDIGKGVGIYGHSAGGQNAMGALLFHPAFYTVAVSSCGCHDNRMDKIWWNEQWMGYPLGPHYTESSNATYAHKLKGKLFLIVGEMDTNVDPSSTMQVVDALIEAKKDFDLLVLPGVGHSIGGDYGVRRRRDFFVKHLLGMDPPEWNTINK